MRVRPVVATALLALVSVAGAQEARRLLQPAVSPDGKTIVFSYQGDIWTVAIEGGLARRLTVHPASDNLPRWSPDGKTIVFASARNGNQDVYAMDPLGRNLRRLTFDSGNETPTGFSPDGRTLFGHTGAWTGGRSNIFRVPFAGGEMIRLTDHPFETAYLPVVSADGKTVIYNRGNYGVASWRKPGVKGSAVGDIWVADNTVPLTNHRNLTRNEDMDLFPQVAADGSITFVSNRGGFPNVWRMGSNGQNPRALTRYNVGTVRYLTTDRSGDVVVFDHDANLVVLNARTGQERRIAVEIPEDARRDLVTETTLTSGVSDLAVAPDGKRAVLVVRGDLFLIPERGGTTRRLTRNPGRESEPVWLDPKTVLHVAAAADGRRELRTVDLDGNVKPFLVDPAVDLTGPGLSPDGRSLAHHRGATELVVAGSRGNSPRTVLRGEFSDALRGQAAYNWSPDSKWLAVAVQTARAGTNIVLVEVATAKTTVIARLPRQTSIPQFMPNGRTVVFSALEGTSFDVFAVDLVPADITFTEDDLDRLDAPRVREAGPVTVRLHEPGIENRLRRLTNGGATLVGPAPDGRTLWVNLLPTGGTPALASVSISGGAPVPITGAPGTAGNLHAVPGAGRSVFLSAGRPFSYTLQGGAFAPIAFSAVQNVNVREEERALFAEVGWALDRLYYDPAKHGKNWTAIRARFAAQLPHVADRADFYALLGEMMEELDSSHLGATAPSEEGVATPDSTALLGIEFDPSALADGKYRIARVLAGSAADHPDVNLTPGTFVTAINGQNLDGKTPIASLLNRQAGRRVRLSITEGDKTREVSLRPGSPAGMAELQYQNWVAWQRRETERLSGGKLAYLHIRGMNEVSLRQFLREIRTLTVGKQGVVVDVRYNGGGNTGEDILNVLIRKPWLVRTTPGTEGLRLSENIFRGDALELPTILLANAASASNAEVFAEGFRRLGLGKFVGERTPGYVIGTGGWSLWDGGTIRMPSIGAYTVDGENLENNGRRPDIPVPFEPNAWSAGRDPQLERAVRELLRP